MRKEIEQYLPLLKSSVLFSFEDDKQIYDALDLLEPEILIYDKGDFIHRSYEPMKKFGFVLSGAVHVCSDDIDGNRIIMAEVQPGFTFGESICYLGIESYPVYAVSFVDTSVLWLSVKELYSNVADETVNEMQKRFTSLLASRTLAMNSRIQILSKLSIREKLLEYFNVLSSVSKNKEFVVPFNREDMATFIGVNRTALSRELSKMKNEGLIEFKKNYFKLIR
ncbi:MAG: Crp/Fnr family transcriptional regulator [Clostridia bacterium]|nr:Crp/Fnr family transcriptional regulator [Clostridia bacterium]